MIDDRKYCRLGGVLILWSQLMDALLWHVESTPVEYFSEYDINRLLNTAKVIRTKMVMKQLDKAGVEGSSLLECVVAGGKGDNEEQVVS